MGTRGFVGFVADDDEKITYNGYDSYPSGAGVDVLEWLRGAVKDEEKAFAQARALAVVPNRMPSADEHENLAEFANRNVGDPRDPSDAWYRLLRGTQGKPDRILLAGLYEDASEFPLDSLFCEWGYLVDFDERVLEVYQGFRSTPATQGRWADPLGRPNAQGYYPVQLRARYSFDLLPTVDEFIARFED